AIHHLRIDAPVPVGGVIYYFWIIWPYAKAHFPCRGDEELTIAIDISHPIIDELDGLKITGTAPCRYSHRKRGRLDSRLSAIGHRRHACRQQHRRRASRSPPPLHPPLPPN